MDSNEGGQDMNGLQLAMKREGALGWKVVRRDGSVAFFSTPAAALTDLISEGEIALGELMGWFELEAVAHA